MTHYEQIVKLFRDDPPTITVGAGIHEFWCGEMYFSNGQRSPFAASDLTPALKKALLDSSEHVLSINHSGERFVSIGYKRAIEFMGFDDVVRVDLEYCEEFVPLPGLTDVLRGDMWYDEAKNELFFVWGGQLTPVIKITMAIQGGLTGTIQDTKKFLGYIDAAEKAGNIAELRCMKETSMLLTFREPVIMNRSTPHPTPVTSARIWCQPPETNLVREHARNADVEPPSKKPRVEPAPLEISYGLTGALKIRFRSHPRHSTVSFGGNTFPITHAELIGGDDDVIKTVPLTDARTLYETVVTLATMRHSTTSARVYYPITRGVRVMGEADVKQLDIHYRRLQLSDEEVAALADRV